MGYSPASNVSPGSADFVLMDTNKDGVIDRLDDPYSAYYPGNFVMN